jgi:hypothetical protein
MVHMSRSFGHCQVGSGLANAGKLICEICPSSWPVQVAALLLMADNLTRSSVGGEAPVDEHTETHERITGRQLAVGEGSKCLGATPSGCLVPALPIKG